MKTEPYNSNVLRQHRVATALSDIKPDGDESDKSNSTNEWERIFAALDRSDIPDDLLADRGQAAPQMRDVLID